jgi:hypothetical protein
MARYPALATTEAAAVASTPQVKMVWASVERSAA